MISQVEHFPPSFRRRTHSSASAERDGVRAQAAGRTGRIQESRGSRPDLSVEAAYLIHGRPYDLVKGMQGTTRPPTGSCRWKSLSPDGAPRTSPRRTDQLAAPGRRRQRQRSTAADAAQLSALLALYRRRSQRLAASPQCGHLAATASPPVPARRLSPIGHYAAGRETGCVPRPDVAMRGCGRRRVSLALLAMVPLLSSCGGAFARRRPSRGAQEIFSTSV